MARRPATARPRRRRGVLRHYGRPLHRDRLFLLVAVASLVVTVVFVALVVLLTGLPQDALGWVRPGIVGVLVALLSFRLLGMGVTSSVKFQEGLRGASAGAHSPPGDGAAPSHDYEATGRAAGAAVGKALRATRSSPRTSAPTPAPPARPSPTPPGGGHEADGEPAAPPAATTSGPPAPGGPTVDRAARVAGAMVGRRLAERRRRDEER